MKRMFSILICMFFCTAIGLPFMAAKVLAYSPESDFTFNSTTHTITSYIGPLGGDVDIPPTIGGISVEHIGEIAFFERYITSVIIPNSVTSIGNSAFDHCFFLSTVKLSDKIISIGDMAFALCRVLTNITIPNGAVDIGMGAFINCAALTSITIPDSVLSIGSSAFAGCNELASVTLPEHITSIEDDTFANCSALTSITIPNGVTSIGNTAFANTSLTSITIPNGVTNIGITAFADCTSLSSAIFTGNAPTTWGNHVFNGAAGNFAIYYYAEKTGFSTPTFHGYNSVPLYRVNTAPTSDGSVTASTNRAASGTTVHLTVTPDTNKFAASLYYTDASGKHTITGNSFIMPSSEVTIHADFTWLPIINLFFAFSYIFLFTITIFGLWLVIRNR